MYHRVRFVDNQQEFRKCFHTAKHRTCVQVTRHNITCLHDLSSQLWLRGLIFPTPVEAIEAGGTVRVGEVVGAGAAPVSERRILAVRHMRRCSEST